MRRSHAASVTDVEPSCADPHMVFWNPQTVGSDRLVMRLVCRTVLCSVLHVNTSSSAATDHNGQDDWSNCRSQCQIKDAEWTAYVIHAGSVCSSRQRAWRPCRCIFNFDSMRARRHAMLRQAVLEHVVHGDVMFQQPCFVTCCATGRSCSTFKATLWHSLEVQQFNANQDDCSPGRTTSPVRAASVVSPQPEVLQHGLIC